MPFEFGPLRRLADKARRRARALVRRPDPSPWVLGPRPAGAGGRYADFVVGLDYLSPNSKLLKLFHDAMAPLGLSVLLVNRANVDRALAAARRDRFHPHLYLDLCSRPGDAFDALLRAFSAAGVHTVARPEQLHWTIKAPSHPALAAAGLPVPPTIVLKPDEPDRDLTPDELALIGDRCVIKPSHGFAGLGAKLNRAPTREVIAAARDYDRKDDWLVQRAITFARAGTRPAYVRAYHVLGHRSLLWWSVERAGYEPLTWADVHQFGLVPALEMVDRVHALTGLDYFSSEIAATADAPGQPVNPAAPNLCLIDYVNDQCDMDPEGSPSGSPPPAWCAWVCRRFADYVFRRKNNLPPEARGNIYLVDPAARPTT